MNKYCLNFEDIKRLTIAEFKDLLKKTEGIPLSNMSLKDLVFIDDEPIYTGNGVYVFKNNDRFIYVGSCCARNFVERIPAHFDIRHQGWFNSLLKNIVTKEYEEVETTDENLTRAARDAFEKYQIVMVNFLSYDKKREIELLEYLLRISLEPLNKFKTKRIIDWHQKIEDYKK